MYLGVHTPLDVGVSLAIGAVLVFVFYPLIQKICRKPNGMYLLLGVMVLVAVAFALYANLNTFPADVDPDNLYSAKKNSFSLLGALLGFCAGYPIEQKYIRFPEKAKFWQQLIKIVGGLAGLMGFKEGITRQRWKEIFDTQDIPAMLDALHKFPVQPGETYLICGNESE